MGIINEQESPAWAPDFKLNRGALLSILAAASVSTIPGLDFMDVELAAAWAGLGLNAAARAVRLKNLLKIKSLNSRKILVIF